MGGSEGRRASKQRLAGRRGGCRSALGSCPLACARHPPCLPAGFAALTPRWAWLPSYSWSWEPSQREHSAAALHWGTVRGAVRIAFWLAGAAACCRPPACHPGAPTQPCASTPACCPTHRCKQVRPARLAGRVERAGPQHLRHPGARFPGCPSSRATLPAANPLTPAPPKCADHAHRAAPGPAVHQERVADRAAGGAVHPAGVQVSQEGGSRAVAVAAVLTGEWGQRSCESRSALRCAALCRARV